MAEKVQFELVSPEKLLLSVAVEMVVVPGVEGYFGVLPGHALFISAVRPGVIDVYDAGQVTERIFVTGGFAEVTPERCTVLADEAVPVASIDRGAAESALKSAEAEMASIEERIGRMQGSERDQAASELAAAAARRTVAEAKLAALAVAPH